MAKKIKCNCGITFTIEKGQTHCNYCGIKLSDIGKEKPSYLGNQEKQTKSNKGEKNTFWQGYIGWIKEKAHLPIFLGMRRLWILLFLTFVIIGQNKLQQNPLLFLKLLDLLAMSLIYYAWQRRVANKKGLSINEIPTNFVALIVIVLVYLAFLYALYI